VNGVGDGRDAEVPWASAFDPAANARALTAIQAEGFRAASQLVDRFVRLASAGLTGESRTASGALSDDQRADLFGATDVEPLIRSWWSVLGQLFVRPAPARPVPPESAQAATLAFSDPEARGQLSLEAFGPGAVAAEVWLHHGGTGDIGEVRLRCSDLLSADGDVVACASVAFSPAVVLMTARSSRGIDVTIDVAADVPAGLYRGTLLVVGHPQLWLPVVLTVHSPVS
jgi:hypothetical protein